MREDRSQSLSRRKGGNTMATSTVTPVTNSVPRYTSAGGLTPKMSQAELMASLLDDNKAKEATDRTPALEGQAYQDPDTGDIIFRFPMTNFAQHVRATDKGAVGIALAIPGKFEVL